MQTKCFLLWGNLEHEVTGYRLRGGRFKTEMWRKYFSQRVVNLWNSLPHSAMESESLNGFKKEIDIFLIKKGYGEQVGDGFETRERSAMI